MEQVGSSMEHVGSSMEHVGSCGVHVCIPLEHYAGHGPPGIGQPFSGVMKVMDIVHDMVCPGCQNFSTGWVR